jgi:hypothetical protein
MDKEADLSCRKGCKVIENAKHILIDFPATENHRQEIRLLLANLNVTMDVNTILGLNRALGGKTQFKIRDALAKFLKITPRRHYLTRGACVSPTADPKKLWKEWWQKKTSQKEAPKGIRPPKKPRCHQARQNQQAAWPVTSSRKSVLVDI